LEQEQKQNLLSVASDLDALLNRGLAEAILLADANEKAQLLNQLSSLAVTSASMSDMLTDTPVTQGTSGVDSVGLPNSLVGSPVEGEGGQEQTPSHSGNEREQDAPIDSTEPVQISTNNTEQEDDSGNSEQVDSEEQAHLHALLDSEEFDKLNDWDRGMLTLLIESHGTPQRPMELYASLRTITGEDVSNRTQYLRFANLRKKISDTEIGKMIQAEGATTNRTYTLTSQTREEATQLSTGENSTEDTNFTELPDSVTTELPPEEVPRETVNDNEVTAIQLNGAEHKSAETLVTYRKGYETAIMQGLEIVAVGDGSDSKAVFIEGKLNLGFKEIHTAILDYALQNYTSERITVTELLDKLLDKFPDAYPEAISAALGHIKLKLEYFEITCLEVVDEGYASIRFRDVHEDDGASADFLV
jgi:hypothetical protein